ncbi:MAG: D-alanine--D-alanine ligase [Candidatus Aureabacteria bacterium]|nr:D-alanine--D-alanine ligase [Candidatus Auribacterota bacterium]
MRIALTCNLKPRLSPTPSREDYYAEWDDRGTIDAVAAALSESGMVVTVEADEDIAENLKKAQPDMVFNIAEGINSPSRESQVPVICELLGIPYTGSDPFTLAACLNKARAKEVMSFHHIPTPAFQVLTHPEEPLNGLKFPVIVKPLWEGSSMGIRDDSLVFDRSDIPSRVERIVSEYRQPAILESFLSGREFTAALLGNEEGLRVLPLVEIDFLTLPEGASRIYSYEAKWVWDTPGAPLKIFTCPAEIEREMEMAIADLCKEAYVALGCRDWCRIDVRLDESMKPHVLELNPLPGILPDPDENSCFPKAARAAGMSYGDLIREVVRIARARYGMGEA